MFSEAYEAAANAAGAKLELLKKNPIGYFLLAVLAGIFIGFGVLLAFSIGGMLGGAPYTKVLMGLSFGIALSLVVIAGAELFTGNNLVMAAGFAKKKVKLSDLCRLWLICYIGNWIGSVLLAVIFHFTGLGGGATGEFIAAAAAGKMGLEPIPLFLRGVLCNVLVCLAVWCSFKCKSESGKLIMIFWCLFAFITTGFEHSIANMTLLTAALLEPCAQAVSIGGYFYNIIIVTLGNMAGGILFVAVPYYVASLNKSTTEK